VDTSDAFTEAIRSIEAHNGAETIDLGHAWSYSMTADGTPFVTGSYSRGEDIELDDACLVGFEGSVWLEVSNGGGGGDTMEYFYRYHSKVGWMWSDGKPEVLALWKARSRSFMEAPIVSGETTKLQQVQRIHDELMNHRSR
jgi:hypothetical protein